MQLPGAVAWGLSKLSVAYVMGAGGEGNGGRKGGVREGGGEGGREVQ